jgi:hypothetical protein
MREDGRRRTEDGGWTRDEGGRRGISNIECSMSNYEVKMGIFRKIQEAERGQSM